MGIINCKKEVASEIPIHSEGKIKIDDFFNSVPTLNQRAYEKWAFPIFSFKILRDGKWYLGTFYSEGNDEGEVGLAFSEFVE